jgi:hypothetical protein
MFEMGLEKHRARRDEFRIGGDAAGRAGDGDWFAGTDLAG